MVTLGDIKRTWPLEIDGKTVELPRPGRKQVELPYLKRLRQQELEGIKDTYALGSQDYELSIRLLNTGFNTRFMWKSQAFRESLNVEKNMLYFMRLWIAQADPTIAEEQVTAAWEKATIETTSANEKIAEEAEAKSEKPKYINNPFYTVLGEMLNDPNHWMPC